MVVRAGIYGDLCNAYYIDVFDIDKILHGVHLGETHISYKKVIPRLLKP
ncbi:hypothetical protein MTBSS4_220001 [Magnetospirillum sp. SS-4]|nr:hypothetical protein MTBSS4_220001 [Magnetospirillum sp. SS-4]